MKAIPTIQVSKIAADVGGDWGDAVQSYYENAESEAWLSPFWGEGSPFVGLFKHLDLSTVVEIATGHGRHAAQLRGKAGRQILVDIRPENIDFCRARFEGEDTIELRLTEGTSLSGIPANWASAVYSYDSMVHFDLLVLWEYLQE